ncbi:MAG: Ig-like domain-containing protein, partial [Bacteroidales bacterium]|nr:Ig-like domain-containing protein [Bacteroidales bacterium]
MKQKFTINEATAGVAKRTLLTAVMLCMMLPMALLAQDTDYGLIFNVPTGKFHLSIDGTGAINATNIEYTGQSDKWSFSSGTLTLNDFVWETPAPVALRIIGGDINVNVERTNTFTSTFNGNASTSGISCSIVLTISGSGTLNATGGTSTTSTSYVSTGITIGGSGIITINGGTVNATGGSSSGSSFGISTNGRVLFITGGTVNATSGPVSGSRWSWGIATSGGWVFITGGTVNAAGGLSSGALSYGISTSGGTLFITGSTVTAQGNTQAIFPANPGPIKLFSQYTCWTNTANANPGGAGTTFPGSTPFTNSDTYKFVKIETSDFFCGGKGIAANPFRICNATQLNAIRDLGLMHFKLNNDIDVAEFIENNDNVNGWLPMGTSSAPFYEVSFNGAGHKITGLWIDRSTTSNVGLFGYTLGSRIDSLGVEIAAKGILGNSYVGGLVGYNSNSSITNSYSTGNVSGNNTVGGLVGYNQYNCTVINAYSTGNVNGNNTVGGLVGDNANSSTIANAYSTGNVSGNNTVGGLVGQNSGATIRNSVAANDNITATGGTAVNRIANGSGTYQNNYANSAMTIMANGAPVTRPDNATTNGTGKPLTTFNSFNFYNSSENWQGGTAWSIDENENPAKSWRICDNNTFPYLQWQPEKPCIVQTYTISLTPSTNKNFGAAIFGYAALTEHEVTITNTGNQPTGALTIALSGTGTGSFTLSTETISDIAIDGNATFTVVPNTGLAIGNYTATVTVSGGNGIEESFDVMFAVYEVPVTCDNNMLWKNNFGGSGEDQYNAVIAVPDGTIAVGYSQTFNSGDWAGITGHGGTSDAIIVKYDNGGNVVWKKNFGGAGPDYFRSVTALSDGVVAVGNTTDSFGTGDLTELTGQGSTDAIIVKYNFDGDIQWKKNFGGSSVDQYNSVTTTSDGIVAVGYAIGGFGTGDLTGLTGQGGYDAIIVKYNFAGDVVWKKNFGGNNWDFYNSVTATSDGIVAAGYSWGGFGTGDLEGLTGQGGTDAIIVKYDNDGNVVWKKNFGSTGGDSFYSVTALSDGVVAAGTSSGGFGSGDLTGLTGRGGGDAIIVKYDLDGNIVWKNNFGGSNDEQYDAVTATSDGIVAAGWAPPSSFGTGDLTGMTGQGSVDAIIVKYDFAGNVVWKNNFGGSNADYYTSVTATADGIVAAGYALASSFGTGDLTGLTGHGSTDAIIVKYGCPLPQLFCGGTGIATDPYQICTFDDLATLATYVNSGNGNATANVYYLLMNDIDMSDWTTAPDALGWMPIGYSATSSTDPARRFEGNFDGGGYKVTGLWIDRGTLGTAGNNIGLFGYIDGARIENLGVEIAAAGIKGYYAVGGLAGRSYDGSIIVNCYVTGTGNVEGSFNTGGLIGSNSGATIENCYVTVNVTGTNNSTGGLVGYSFSGSFIKNSYATGNIQGGTETGGLVGSHSNSTIENCYATGNVTGTSSVGGLMGSNYSNAITSNSYATGNVNGRDDTGGVVGLNNSSATIKNCVAANTSITRTLGSQTTFNRIAGRNASNLINNYANEAMTVKHSTGDFSLGTIGLNEMAGEDTTMETLQTFAFYNTASNWNSSAWDICAANGAYPVAVWAICENTALPHLRWQDIECEEDDDAVTGVEIANCPENGWLFLYDNLQMETQILPPTATNQNVIWFSTNPNTATVDNSGLVTAKGIGATVIKATTIDGGLVAECFIRVISPVAGVMLNKSTTILAVGGIETLKATVYPENASVKDVKWSSANEGVATVVDGKVTAIADGTTTITVTTVEGGYTATCVVTVVTAYITPTGITMTPTTLSLDRGKSHPLKADVKPAGANPLVTWSSSNTAIATVDDDGIVTAKAAGKVTITAKTVNGLGANCTVTVTIPVESIEVTPEDCTLALKGTKALKAAVFPSDATNKTIVWSSS